jgi:ParB family transcriptional regulator, chromosome partitioning protein
VSRRSGLGRGLDALLPASGPEDPPAGGGLLRLPVDAIAPNPRQPRQDFDEDEIEELATSIATLGILQPLLVRESGPGRYELIAGERRLRASKLAGLSEVPVLVVETDERGSLERAIVENVHRSNLSPIEEAAAYKQLIDEGGLTQERLAERLGKNRVTITNILRLLDLPTSIQALLGHGRLTAGHGKALLSLQGNPLQERLARRAAEEGMSVRDTEELARKFESMGTPASRSGGRGVTPASVSDAQRRLADHLQTRVRIDVGKRKGKIVVDFVSLEELERLMQTILGEQPGGMPRTASLD